MTRFRYLALAVALLASAPAAAEPPIEVGVGRAALLTLAKPARSVVVGNPEIADVSVEGPSQIVVFGRSPGGTTLTVLGSGKSVLLSADVVVLPGGGSGVTVTYGTGKSVERGGTTVTYACGVTCARTLPATATPGGAAPAAKTAE